MPTYDYQCEDCGKNFSQTQSITTHDDTQITCPSCESHNVARVFLPFYAKTIRKS